MKRHRSDLWFWAAYLIYDVLLHYTWMGTTMAAFSQTAQIGMAVKTALILLPAKILLVYYLTQVGVLKILNDERNRLFTFLEIVFVYLILLLLFRAVFYYIVYPYFYLQLNKVSFFNARAILISILEMGFIGGAAFALKLYRLQTAAREREKNLIKEKLETELKFLRNQTNPHFLFNTLNNIYALARKKSDKTPEVVMKLSELLNFMLYESGKETIAIDEEIKMMQDYIDLQKIRYSDRLSVQFDKNIDDKTQPIAPLLLLPLVENAFKYGVSETRFNSFIHIDFKMMNGNVYFCIENTTDDNDLKHGNGQIGLKNMKRQLELMYADHDIESKNENGTFQVKASINLNSYGKI